MDEEMVPAFKKIIVYGYAEHGKPENIVAFIKAVQRRQAVVVDVRDKRAWSYYPDWRGNHLAALLHDTYHPIPELANTAAETVYGIRINNLRQGLNQIEELANETIVLLCPSTKSAHIHFVTQALKAHGHTVQIVQ